MNTSRSAAAALAVIALLGGSARAAGAQEPAEIRIGSTVSGTLTPSDPVMADRGPVQVYRFWAEEGERLVATLRSGAFDAYLTLLRGVAGVTEVVGWDDDGGGGTDARLRFRVPATGIYYLVAQSFSQDGTGGYSLSLEPAPEAKPATPLPIRIGETREGVILEDDPALDEEGNEVPYHLYTFEARDGQRLVVAMESEDFDTFLAFGPLVGGQVEVTATDDDGGEGSNSRLRLAIPRDGSYGVHARPLGPGETGAYSITLREAVSVSPRPVTAGQEVQGVLGEEDPDEEQKYFQEWLYQGSAGETLRVWLRSGEFDAFLSFGRWADGVFQVMESNDDDEAGSTDSHLEITLPEAGAYLIRATTFHRGSTGSYTLRVESGGRSAG